MLELWKVVASLEKKIVDMELQEFGVGRLQAWIVLGLSGLNQIISKNPGWMVRLAVRQMVMLDDGPIGLYNLDIVMNGNEKGITLAWRLKYSTLGTRIANGNWTSISREPMNMQFASRQKDDYGIMDTKGTWVRWLRHRHWTKAWCSIKVVILMRVVTKKGSTLWGFQDMALVTMVAHWIWTFKSRQELEALEDEWCASQVEEFVVAKKANRLRKIKWMFCSWATSRGTMVMKNESMKHSLMMA